MDKYVGGINYLEKVTWYPEDFKNQFRNIFVTAKSCYLTIQESVFYIEDLFVGANSIVVLHRLDGIVDHFQLESVGSFSSQRTRICPYCSKSNYHIAYKEQLEGEIYAY